MIAIAGFTGTAAWALAASITMALLLTVLLVQMLVFWNKGEESKRWVLGISVLTVIAMVLVSLMGVHAFIEIMKEGLR